MTNPEVLKIKQARRLILEALNMMYPTAILTETVFRVCISIDPTYEWHLFEKDIYYLAEEEKEYLVFVGGETCDRLPFKKRAIKLTAAGKDIADRTMNDPTLEI